MTARRWRKTMLDRSAIVRRTMQNETGHQASLNAARLRPRFEISFEVERR
jgi:hypothetical protein